MQTITIAVSALIGFTFLCILFISSIKIIRPTNRGLIERLGKYHAFGNPGLNIVLPFIDNIIMVNITEKMVDVEKQEIITADSLNAQVAAQIYYKIKDDADSVKKSQYNVNVIDKQIVALARTSLRNIIGGMTLSDANSKRSTINTELVNILEKETINWGIEIVRAELKEIDPPTDVQHGMNQVVVAKNEKTAAIDFATAAETKADGEKRAQIKMAEAQKQSRILDAEGQKEAKIAIATGDAEAIKLVNESAEKYFTGRAQALRSLVAFENSMKNNAKILLPGDKSISSFIATLTTIGKAVGADLSAKEITNTTDRPLEQ